MGVGLWIGIWACLKWARPYLFKLVVDTRNDVCYDGGMSRSARGELTELEMALLNAAISKYARRKKAAFCAYQGELKGIEVSMLPHLSKPAAGTHNDVCYNAGMGNRVRGELTESEMALLDAAISKYAERKKAAFMAYQAELKKIGTERDLELFRVIDLGGRGTLVRVTDYLELSPSTLANARVRRKAQLGEQWTEDQS